jgi:hypothetical protein
MKPVEQTRLSGTDGNCFAACLASLFEVALDEVPQATPQELDKHNDDGWLQYTERLNQEFLLPRGFYIVTFKYDGWKPRGYALLAAQSPRHDGLHSVVCLDGEIVYDPHPRRDMGVGEWKEWDVLMVADPMQAMRFLQ